ncbi:MAG: hypothetical protein AAFQ66_02855 [Pseudomonadota bacterium]
MAPRQVIALIRRVILFTLLILWPAVSAASAFDRLTIGDNGDLTAAIRAVEIIGQDETVTVPHLIQAHVKMAEGNGADVALETALARNHASDLALSQVWLDAVLFATKGARHAIETATGRDLIHGPR